MVIRSKRFNHYLILGLLVVLWNGCTSTPTWLQAKRPPSTLRLYVEVNPDAAKRSQEVKVHGVPLIVEKEAALTESNIKKASIIESPGGFALRLQFDRQGTWLLENVTVENRGKRLGVFSQWIEPPNKEVNLGRWLGAPMITKHIGDGVIVFTPDATREELEHIVAGINNVARYIDQEVTNRW